MRVSDEQHLLGVDVGGTAVKVALFDVAGNLLGLHETPIPIHSARPGWAEIDPQRWLEAIVTGVRRVVFEAGSAPERVAALGLSNMIGTVILLDAHGRPLRPAIAYLDTRSIAEAAWMLERAPEIPQVTGNRILPGNTSLTSALWIRAHEPEIAMRAATYAQVNTFLFRWLTGERRADWTNASFMGLFDYARMSWSAALAEKLHVDPSCFAPVEAPHSVAPLLPEVARDLGLRAGTPVALGGIDGAMSSVGVGAIHIGEAYDVSGTSEMVAVCAPNPIVCPELLGRWHVVPGVWACIGAMSTSGAALQWFRDQLFAPEGRQDSQALYAAMTAEAEASPPGANGVVFLPHLMGERAPIWDPYARGVFFGLTLGSKRGDLIRAVMEGAAYAMRHLIELIELRAGLPVRRVMMVGGAARNPLWRRIKTDVWGIEVATPAVSQATVLGAALTAGVGVGLYADYEEAVKRAVPPAAEALSPDPAAHAAYERTYQVYRRLYPALAETMHFAAGA